MDNGSLVSHFLTTHWEAATVAGWDAAKKNSLRCVPQSQAVREKKLDPQLLACSDSGVFPHTWLVLSGGVGAFILSVE